MRYTDKEITEAVETIKNCYENILENDEEPSDEEKEHLREAYKILTETSEELRHTYESMTKKLAKSSKTPVFTKNNFDKTGTGRQEGNKGIPGWDAPITKN